MIHIAYPWSFCGYDSISWIMVIGFSRSATGTSVTVLVIIIIFFYFLAITHEEIAVKRTMDGVRTIRTEISGRPCDPAARAFAMMHWKRI